MSEMCHCGRPLHYTDSNIEKYVRDQIAKFGENIPIKITDDPCKVYLVPRHYMALHGLNACDLDSLGFEVKYD